MKYILSLSSTNTIDSFKNIKYSKDKTTDKETANSKSMRSRRKLFVKDS